ncbi:MAG TPA: hypothetical protein VFJ91_05995 [Gaiellaceae bacterium]|nr:hypothetical protein [Gaiellaceae bacterium]
MKELTRKSLLVRAGAVAAGGAVASAVRAVPALAAPGDDLVGYVHDMGGHVYNVKASYDVNIPGAKGDTKLATGGTIQAGSLNTLTTSAATFAVGVDEGKVVTVQGAGASNGVHVAKIQTVNSTTSVTLDVAASTAVSNADFSFGTDDTAAIAKAVTEAGTAGIVFAPPGIYTITSMIQINPSGGDQVGLVGGGGRCIPDVSAAATVFLCANAGAGVLANGWASFQGFLVHGNNIATAPLANGVLSSGTATDGNSYCTFVDVWSTAAHYNGSNGTGNGWNIFGCQNNTYWDCGTTNNGYDGLYIDGGAGGHEFWRFHESGSKNYGVHGDMAHQALGGYTAFTANNHFFGGELISDSTTQQGVSKIYGRGGEDWKFLDMQIVGDNLSGPTVDLGQGSALGAYGYDFSGSTLSATPKSQKPGNACIQISEGPFYNTTWTFAKMDRVRFLAGDSSVYIAANNGYFRYSAIGWIADDTTYGPVGASNIDQIDTLLEGRTGAWQTPGVNGVPALNSGWSGTVSYRIRSDRVVELKGSATCSTGAGTTIFSLPAGYLPSGGTLRFAVSTSNGIKYVTVAASGGAVAIQATSNGLTVYLDAVSFAID